MVSLGGWITEYVDISHFGGNLTKQCLLFTDYEMSSSETFSFCKHLLIHLYACSGYNMEPKPLRLPRRVPVQPSHTSPLPTRRFRTGRLGGQSETYRTSESSLRPDSDFQVRMCKILQFCNFANTNIKKLNCCRMRVNRRPSESVGDHAGCMLSITCSL